MLAYPVLRLRGHDRTRAAALVLSYRTEAQLVPAYVRSVERWLATAATVTSAITTSQRRPPLQSGLQPEPARSPPLCATSAIPYPYACGAPSWAICMRSPPSAGAALPVTDKPNEP
jgi:hypothetical protein